MNSKTTVDQSTELLWRDITLSRATAKDTKKVFLVLMHRGGRNVMHPCAWTRTTYEVHYMPRFKQWRASERMSMKRGHTLYHYDREITNFDTREEACGFLEATYMLMDPVKRGQFIGATNALNN